MALDFVRRCLCGAAHADARCPACAGEAYALERVARRAGVHIPGGTPLGRPRGIPLAPEEIETLRRAIGKTPQRAWGRAHAVSRCDLWRALSGRSLGPEVRGRVLRVLAVSQGGLEGGAP